MLRINCKRFECDQCQKEASELCHAADQSWYHGGHFLFYKTGSQHIDVCRLCVASNTKPHSCIVTQWVVRGNVADILCQSTECIIVVILTDGSYDSYKFCTFSSDWSLVMAGHTLSDDPCQVLQGGCCLIENCLYWQRCTFAHTVSLNRSDLQTGHDPASHGKVACRVLLSGCMPCDLYARDEQIFALPRESRWKCLTLVLDSFRIRVSLLKHGVVFSDVLGASYQRVVATLALPLYREMLSFSTNLQHIMSPGVNYLLCVDTLSGALWEWCMASAMFEETHGTLDIKYISSHLFVYRGEIISVLSGSLWSAQLGDFSHWDELSLGTVIKVFSNHEKWPVAISSSGVFHLMRYSRNAEHSSESTIPDSLADLEASFKRFCKLESSSDYVSRLLDNMNNTARSCVAGIPDLYIREESQPRPYRKVLVTNAEDVLLNITEENMFLLIPRLMTMADTNPEDSYIAFVKCIFHHEQRESAWPLLFSVREGRCFPLISIFLRLVFKLQPFALVDCVLMTGSEYLRITGTESAPKQIVDDLLSSLLLMKERDTDHVLALSRLFLLSSRYQAPIEALKLLLESSLWKEAVILTAQFSSDCSLFHLCSQLLAAHVIKEFRDKNSSSYQSKLTMLKECCWTLWPTQLRQNLETGTGELNYSRLLGAGCFLLTVQDGSCVIEMEGCTRGNMTRGEENWCSNIAVS